MHYLCMQAVAINNRSLLKTPARPRIFPRWNTTSQSPFSDPISFDARASFWLILTLDANSSSFFFPRCNCQPTRAIMFHIDTCINTFTTGWRITSWKRISLPLWCLKISAMLVEWISLGAILAKTSTLVSEYQTFYRNSSHPARKFHPERNDDTTRGYIFQTFLSSWAEFWRNQTLSFVKFWIFGLDIQNAYITKSIREKQSDS